MRERIKMLYKYKIRNLYLTCLYDTKYVLKNK